MANHATKRALTLEPPEQSNENDTIHEQVTALAHALWQERGCPEGTPEVDWFRAEELMRPEAGKTMGAAA